MKADIEKEYLKILQTKINVETKMLETIQIHGRQKGNKGKNTVKIPRKDKKKPEQGRSSNRTEIDRRHIPGKISKDADTIFSLILENRHVTQKFKLGISQK